ncbi:MAG: matrixin family metalloprotease [Myxococcota bacterium]
MKRVLFLVCIILVPLTMSFKTLKDAYQEEGMVVYGETHWLKADMPVKYSINELGSADISGDSEFTAINNAFASWTGVNCGSYMVDLSVNYLGKTSNRATFFDGKNTIDFVENKSEWPPEAGAQAIAFTVPSIREDGIIVEADLRFNGVNYTWSTSGSYGRMDVETIALHELGHFFGLADLYDNYSCYTIRAVMCGYGDTGTKRTLKQDDKDGICYLYNPNVYYQCSRISDCKDGFVCKPYVNLEGETTTYCLEPYCIPKNTNDPYCNNPLNTKAVDSGNRCGDINNTPLNIGDDIFCKNQMCLSSGVCSGVCVSDSDCPKNMKCENITIKIDETTNATLKACNTPPGCKSNKGCPQDKACTIYRAGSALISVCNNYIGTQNVGDGCSKNTDCKTGICYNNYCSAFCSLNADCNSFGGDYTCTKDITITYDGLSDKFSICTRSSVVNDAGVDVAFDVPADVASDGTSDIIAIDISSDVYRDIAISDVSNEVYDHGLIDTDSNSYDTGIIKDAGTSSKDIIRIDTSEECICDMTYGCDPDCECDPECAEGLIDNSQGCGCTILN